MTIHLDTKIMQPSSPRRCEILVFLCLCFSGISRYYGVLNFGDLLFKLRQLSSVDIFIEYFS